MESSVRTIPIRMPKHSRSRQQIEEQLLSQLQEAQTEYYASVGHAERAIALKRYIRALHRLEEMVLYGLIPDDL